MDDEVRVLAIEAGSLGHFMEMLLEARNLSIRELARTAEVSDSSIRNLIKCGVEETAKLPTPSVLRSVANALKASMAVLLYLAGYLTLEELQGLESGRGANTLAECLKELMKDRNLNAAELAGRAGVSPSVITNLLRQGIDDEQRAPDPKTLIAVSAALGTKSLILLAAVGYCEKPLGLSALGLELGCRYDRLSNRHQRAVWQLVAALDETT